ncbi:DUF3800 domain-containing protein [Aeromonas salmonicida]|uniref:DUF3800 domain-containing protein n=1 Tax=Aeromonas salmonicida TaxID=645 RepID=UPI00259EE6A6|nr:DUF3800 domain-containing protein [Aeromonas salmonicida]MDM5061374.1 DUF3800 domain-containing protein [Aeromonas salmonicida]
MSNELKENKPNAFVYADESGHSGKNIFDDASPVYFQGALVSVGDIDHIVSPIIEDYCKKHNLDRLHGFELGEDIVNALCVSLLSALDKTDWVFHYTIIQKNYMASTKFVDIVFDSFNNPAVHPLWYNVPLFRHMLSVSIDEIMEPELKKDFWGYFISDEVDGMVKISEILLGECQRISDPRTREVVVNGLSYAISNPDIFSLESSKGKSAYKTQTPNMVAFSSLLMAVHRFCKPRNIGVHTFIHDQNDQFKGTMREYHRLFFGFDIEKDKFGGLSLLKEVSYELGEFKLESSKKSYGLQVVDLFLWLVQRDFKNPKLILTREKLMERSDNFFISREMSLKIIHEKTMELMQEDFSVEQIEKAKGLNMKIINGQADRMAKE